MNFSLLTDGSYLHLVRRLANKLILRGDNVKILSTSMPVPKVLELMASTEVLLTFGSNISWMDEHRTAVPARTVVIHTIFDSRDISRLGQNNRSIDDYGYSAIVTNSRWLAGQSRGFIRFVHYPIADRYFNQAPRFTHYPKTFAFAGSISPGYPYDFLRDVYESSTGGSRLRIYGNAKPDWMLDKHFVLFKSQPQLTQAREDIIASALCVASPYYRDRAFYEQTSPNMFRAALLEVPFITLHADYLEDFEDVCWLPRSGRVESSVRDVIDRAGSPEMCDVTKKFRERVVDEVQPTDASFIVLIDQIIEEMT